MLFLDEPTTGLDPRGRLGMWDIITTLVGEGTTVLLTTQYLEEADRLADGISVIDEGSVIAQGTADELKASIGGAAGGDQPGLRRMIRSPRGVLTRFGSAEPTVPATDASDREGGGSAGGLQRMLARVRRRRHPAATTRASAATLDDVFLRLTGTSRRRSRGKPSDDAGAAGEEDGQKTRREEGRAEGIMTATLQGGRFGTARPGASAFSHWLSDGWITTRRNLIKIKRVPDIVVFTAAADHVRAAVHLFYRA